MNINIKCKRCLYLLVAFTTILWVYIGVVNISDSYLWYDESGQFYISKGLNHYSDPLSPPSDNISDVIYNNRHFNKDPGGFSILLHYWSLISTNVYYLRLLPFVFYTLFLFFTFLSFKKIYNEKTLATIVTGIMMLTPAIGAHIAELRAYSMELLGMSFALYAIISNIWRSSNYTILLFAVILSFFCTSRYGFIVDSFAVIVYCGLKILKEYDLKEACKRLMILGLPLLSIVVFVYIVTMRYQSSGIDHMGYAIYLSDDWRNLFKPLSILFYINCGFFFYYKYKCTRSNFLNIVLGFSSVYFVFSIIGAYPWDNTRSISLTYILFIGLYYNILNIFQSNAFFQKVVIYGYSLLIVVCIASKFSFHPKYGDAYHELISLLGNANYNSIYIDVNVTPDIKYQFEYGELKDSQSEYGYPNRFYFQTGPAHSSSSLESYIIKTTNQDDFNCNLYLFNDGCPKQSVNKYRILDGYQYFYTKID